MDNLAVLINQAVDSSVEMFGQRNGLYRWAKEEDDFLRTHLGYMTDAEMAKHLGRTEVAVHIRWAKYLDLTAPSKVPNWSTANRVAERLSIDVHTVTTWTDREMIPYRLVPGDRRIRLIQEVTLRRFITNPLNWPYFQPWARTIADPVLARLVARKMELWPDQWLRIGEAAKLRGVGHPALNTAIHKGKLPAIQWGNWWIRRSVILDPAIRFYTKNSVPRGGVEWTPAADTFLILAYAVGHYYIAIEKMMKLPARRTEYHLNKLMGDRPDYVQSLIRKAHLPVTFNPAAKTLIADWYAPGMTQRFPYLVDQMERFCAGQRQGLHLSTIRNVLGRWAKAKDQAGLYRAILKNGAVTLPKLANYAHLIPGLADRMEDPCV